MLTENKEDYNDESVYQPEPVDLGVEDVTAPGTNRKRFSMMYRQSGEPCTHRYMSHLNAQGTSESTQLTL